MLIFLTISVALGGALTAGLMAVWRGRIDEITRILGANLVAFLLVCLAWVGVDRWDPEHLPSSLSNMIAVSLMCQVVWVSIAFVRNAHAPAPRPLAAPGTGGANADEPTSDAASDEHPETATGFVRRHWGGEYSLGVSVWAVTVPGLILVSIARHLFKGLFELEPEISETTYVAIDFAIVGFGILFAAWALVGTWRSTARHERARKAAGKSAFWAGAAGILVGLALIRLITITFQTLAALAVAMQSLHGDDPTIPPYSIRVMRNGTEAEIDGGFRHGVARDLIRVLRATPSIRILHLTSVGGSIDEGEFVYDVVRRGGLETFVPATCDSACTLAFAGGAKRWITNESELGFHAPTVTGVNPLKVSIETRRTIEEMREIYRAADFDRAFVERALATSATEMLRPSPADLLKFHVATGIAEPDRFAASGLNLSDRKSAAAYLTGIVPAFAAVEERHPDTFAEMADALLSDYESGASRRAALEKPISMMLNLLKESLRTADDETQVEYLKLLADVAIEARTRKVADCVDIFETFPGLYALEIESENLSQRRDRLAERTVRTASDDNRRDEEKVKRNARRFMGLVATKIGADDFALMVADHRSESDDDRYCSAWIAAMRLAETMPPALPADFARRLRR